MTVKNNNNKKVGKNEVKDVLLEKLISFGFSQSEATIYLYLLKKGTEIGGSKIAIGTGLHRQYVYLALPRLLEEGLVEEVSFGKQSKYKARPPHILETIGRKKALEAGELASELNMISNVGNEQDFEVIQGKHALQEYELLCVSQAVVGEEEYIIGGASVAFGEIMGDALAEYLYLKQEKKIAVQYLGTEDERSFYQKYIGKFENQEYRFMEKLPKGKTHMIVRKDTVSFYSFLNPPLVYVVHSKEIAEHYRAFFEMLWGMSAE